MKEPKIRQGKISEHFRGLGTVTPEMVRQRAREIALINGRSPDTYTEDDWQAAKLELTGAANDRLESDTEEIHGSKLWDETPGTSGHKTPVRTATDEQTFAEQLAQDGVEEANHDKMLQGSKSDINQA
jgi:hypothetical protein